MERDQKGSARSRQRYCRLYAATKTSDKTFDMINEKNNAKTKDPQRYKELKSEVQKMLRKDKQKHLDHMCGELESASATLRMCANSMEQCDQSQGNSNHA